MFSIMDFFPTFARIAGGEVPDDRPIDGIDQTALLLGSSDTGSREHLLTFVGSDLVAARWKQFRAYFVDVAPSRSGWGGEHLMGGIGASAAPLNGYTQGVRSRFRPARGTQYRRNVQLGHRAVAEKRGGVQGDPREASELAGRQHDQILK